MSNKGKPAGKTKFEGTGTPSDFNPGDIKKDEKLTNEYTDDDKKTAGKVRSGHPNRNLHKKDATNAGGYKN
jgi:hypothetical protein